MGQLRRGIQKSGMILWIPILSSMFEQSRKNLFTGKCYQSFGLQRHLKLLFESPQQGKYHRTTLLRCYVISYPALQETPRTKRTIFQISQATRLSWKIVSLQHCFVKFGSGADDIFLQKCKISNRYFLQLHFTCNPYYKTISLYTHE